jgi:radical SAM superfamily enzyme YgiQ (UPF0313 family)
VTIDQLRRKGPAEAVENMLFTEARPYPRFTLVLPRTESMRSSAVSMAGAEHLGLGSMTAYLRSRGFPVTQINYQLSTFFNAWDGLVDHRTSYSAEALAAEILSTAPDVVGFCVTSMTLLETLKMCEIIRAQRPKMVIGLGGPHAILCADELMQRFPVLDFIGMNDGERAMALLAEALVRGVFPCAIPEMKTRESARFDAGILATYNAMPKGIEDLPMPARDDLLWMLLRAPITESRITTSRGCNYDCTFCIDAMRYDRKWLHRGATQTVDEIEIVNRRLGITHFWMSDDNFLTGAPASRLRAKEIADQLMARGLDVTYRVRFRSDTFVDDPGLLGHLAASGLVAAFVGLEAGSEAQLERFKKRTTVDQHKVMVRQMREEGVALQCGFIMFEPYGSFDDLEASATFLREIEEMYLESNFTHSLDVFPGTEIAEQMRRDGLLHENFDATSPYDAYEFHDRHLGRFAKLIEEAHDHETVTRDKWLYRFRTNLLPRAYRKLRDRKEVAGWRAREEAIIRDLNEANTAFFMRGLDEARRGEPGRRFVEYRDAAWQVQRIAERQLADLYREVSRALPGDGAPRRVASAGKRPPAALLPGEIRARVDAALERLSADGPFTVHMLEGGNLNHTVLLEGPLRRFVFRSRKDAARDEIAAYLGGLYGAALMDKLGGEFRFRTLDEELDFITRARAAGIRTPGVVCRGEDWAVLEFVEGRTLAETLGADGCPAIVLRLLFQLASAHKQGFILADRWGANEIVDTNGHLHFIDFDLEWLPRREPNGLKEMEMGVAFFGAILHASRRADLLDTLCDYGLPLLHLWGYDLSLIAQTLEGYRRFYLAADKPTTALSADPSVYRGMIAPLERIIQTLQNGAPVSIAVGQLV